MQAFTVHQGLVLPWIVPMLIRDMIIPKQFLKSIKRTGFGVNLFDELRYQDEGYPGRIAPTSTESGVCPESAPLPGRVHPAGQTDFGCVPAGNTPPGPWMILVSAV